MRRFLLILLTICFLCAIAEDTGLFVSERLSDLGYLFDAAEEVPEFAIKNFQRANRLFVTGELDENTLNALFSADALSFDEYINNSVNHEITDLYYTDAGGDVTKLKRRLNMLGYYGTDFSELYDINTAGAVARFQMANGLDINGDAWGSTAQRIYSPYAVEYTDFTRSFNLSLGDGGYAVKQAQEYLQALGFYGGSITGFYGEGTFDAVKTFQKANGFTVDGVWDIVYTVLAHNSLLKSAEDYDSFTTEATISVGYRGEEVLGLENALYSLGFFSGLADEEFDESTLSSLKMFQEANGLEISGSLDTFTREALFGDAAKTDFTQFKYACMDKHVGTGDSGYAVKLLTLQLKKLGYPIDVTDLFDEQTLETLLKFQKAEGLEASGEADAPTRERLYREECQTYASASIVLAEIETEEAHDRRRLALEQMLTELIDMPYSAGMTGPESFGVGGFTYYCMQKVGVEVPPTCQLQYELAVTKDGFSLEPADIQKLSLVFFQNDEYVYSGIALGEGLVVYASPELGCVTTLSMTDLTDAYTFKGTVNLLG